jgi:hypothetical protein
MSDILKRWWNGQNVPPKNDPRSDIVIVRGYYERHWSSKAAHVVAGFWMEYWQWCMGFGLAIVGLIWKH